MPGNMDERVVSMEFDNRRFEKNVKHSMKTLDDLKEALDFEKSAESLEDLDKGFKNFGKQNPFPSVNESVSALQMGMSRLGDSTSGFLRQFAEITKITAMIKMAERAIRSLESYIKQFTIAPISEGFEKYTTKIGAIKTISNATSLEAGKVNDELERLNWFTDETSASFGNMVDNIGKFTSVGRQLGESITAMEGIATWGYHSGAGVQEINRAMYNLSQALGTGSVKLIDWKSIENAGMATKEFKEQAIAAAEAAGTLVREGDKLFAKGKGKSSKKTEVNVSNFNSTLQNEWFTSEVLMDTLKVYGDFADKLRDYMEKHPQYNTAAAAMEAMDEERLAKETGIYDKYMDTWTKTSKKSSKKVKEDIQRINKISNVKEREKEIKAWAKTMNMDVKEATKVLDSLAACEETLGEKAFKSSQQAKSFSEAVEATKDAVSTQWMNTFQHIFGGLDESIKVWTDVTDILWDLFASGGAARNNAFLHWAEEFGGRDDLWGEDGVLHNIMDTIIDLKDLLGTSFRNVFFPDLEKVIGKVIGQDERIQAVQNGLFTDDQIRNAREGSYFGRILKNITKSIKDFTARIRAFFTNEENVEKIKQIFTAVATVVKFVGNLIGNVFSAIDNFVKKSGIIQDILNLASRVAAKVQSIFEEIQQSGFIADVFTRISDSMTWFYEKVKTWINQISEFFEETGIADAVRNFFHRIKVFFLGGEEDVDEHGKKTESGFFKAFAWTGKVKEWLDKLNLKDVLYNIKEFFDNMKLLWHIFIEGKGYDPKKLTSKQLSLVSGVEQFLTKIRTAWAKVKAFFQPAIDWIKGIFDKIVGFLEDKGILPAIRNFWEKVKNFFGNIGLVWDYFVNGNKNIDPSKMSEGQLNLISGIEQFLTRVRSVYETAKGWVDTAIKWVSDRWNEFSGWLETSGILPTLRSWWDGITGWINELEGPLGTIRDFFSNIWNTILGWLGLGGGEEDELVELTEYATPLAGFVATMKMTGEELTGTATNNSKTATKKGGLLGTIQTFIEGVKNVFGKAKEIFDKVVSWVTEKWNLFTGWLESSGILPKIREIWKTVTDIFGNFGLIWDYYINGNQNIDPSKMTESQLGALAKVGQIFTKVKKVVDKVKGWFGKAVEWISEKWQIVVNWLETSGILPKIRSVWKTITDVFGNIGMLWDIFVNKQGAYNPKNLTKDQLNIVQKIEGFINTVKEKFEAIKQKFTEIKEAVVGWLEGTGILPTIREWWQKISEFFEEIWASIGDGSVFQKVGDFFSDIWGKILGLFGGGGGEQKVDLSNQTPQVTGEGSVGGGFFDTIINAFKDENGNFNLLKGIAAGFTGLIKTIGEMDWTSMSSSVFGVIVDIINGINEACGRLEIDNIIAVIQKILGAFTGVMILKSITDITSTIRAIVKKGKDKSLLEQFADLLSALGSALLQIGVAVALIAGSIWLLSTIKSENMGKATGVIIGIGAFFILVMAYAAIFGRNKNMSNMIAAMGSAFIQIGIAVGLISLSIIALTVLMSFASVGAIIAAVALVAAIMVGMVAIIKWMSKITGGNMVRISAGIAVFAGMAILLGAVTLCLILMQGVNWGKALIDLVLLAAAMAGMVIAIKALGKVKINAKTITMAIIMAALIGIITAAFLLLQNVDQTQMLVITVLIASVIGVFVGAIMVLQNVNPAGALKAALAIGLFIAAVGAGIAAAGYLIAGSAERVINALVNIMSSMGAASISAETVNTDAIMRVLGCLDDIVAEFAKVKSANTTTALQVASDTWTFLNRFKLANYSARNIDVSKFEAIFGKDGTGGILQAIQTGMSSVTETGDAAVTLGGNLETFGYSLQLLGESGALLATEFGEEGAKTTYIQGIKNINECMGMLSEISSKGIPIALTSWMLTNLGHNFELLGTSLVYVGQAGSELNTDSVYGEGIKNIKDRIKDLQDIVIAALPIVSTSWMVVSVGDNFEKISNSLIHAGEAGTNLGEGSAYESGIYNIHQRVKDLGQIVLTAIPICSTSWMVATVGDNFERVANSLIHAGQAGTKLGPNGAYAVGINSIKDRMTTLNEIVAIGLQVASSSWLVTGVGSNIETLAGSLVLVGEAGTKLGDEGEYKSGIENIKKRMEDIQSIVQMATALVTVDNNGELKHFDLKSFAEGISMIGGALAIYNTSLKTFEDEAAKNGEGFSAEDIVPSVSTEQIKAALQQVIAALPEVSFNEGDVKGVEGWAGLAKADSESGGATTKFAIGLANLGSAMVFFSDSAKQFDDGNSQKAIKALGMLVEIYQKIQDPTYYTKKMAQTSAWEPGDKDDNSSFANKIINMAIGLAAFSTCASDYNEEKGKIAIGALSSLVGIYTELKNPAKYTSKISATKEWDVSIGDVNTEGSFSNVIIGMGIGLAAFSTCAGDYDAAKGETAIKALTSLVAIYKDLQQPEKYTSKISNTKKWDVSLGDVSTPGSFSNTIIGMGVGLAAFSTCADGYDKDKGKVAIEALTSLVAIYKDLKDPGKYTSKIDDTKGWNVALGDVNTEGSFANTIIGMGVGLAAFSTCAEKYKSDEGQKAIDALCMLKDIYKEFANPSEYNTTIEGIAAWEKHADVEKKGSFANAIVGMGTAMAAFGNAVSTLPGDSVTQATNALQTLVAIYKELSGQDALAMLTDLAGEGDAGVVELMSKISSKSSEQVFTEFGEGIGKLGDAMQAFGEQVSGTEEHPYDPDKVAAAIELINQLGKLEIALKTANVDKQWWTIFTSESTLKSLGEHMGGLGARLSQLSKEVHGNFNIDITSNEWKNIQGVVSYFVEMENSLNTVASSVEEYDDKGNLISNTTGSWLFSLSNVASGMNEIRKSLVEFSKSMSIGTTVGSNTYKLGDWAESQWNNIKDLLDVMKGITIDFKNAGLSEGKFYDLDAFGYDLKQLFTYLDDDEKGINHIAEFSKKITFTGSTAINTTTLNNFVGNIKALAEATGTLSSTSVKKEDVTNMVDLVKGIVSIDTTGWNAESFNLDGIAMATEFITGFIGRMNTIYSDAEEGEKGYSIGDAFENLIRTIEGFDNDFYLRGKTAGGQYAKGFNEGLGGVDSGKLTPIISIDENGNPTGGTSGLAALINSEHFSFMATNIANTATRLDEIKTHLMEGTVQVDAKKDGTLMSTADAINGKLFSIMDNMANVRTTLDTLETEVTNLKVVMNSGVLVGEIIDDIDRELGKRSKP